MKIADAYHALAMAMNYYAPFPEDAARYIRDRIGYTGRVYYDGEWMDIDRLVRMVPHWKSVGDVRLTFWGGPPGRQKFYTGNLLQFVYDKLHFELLVNKDVRGIVHTFCHHRMMDCLNQQEVRL